MNYKINYPLYTNKIRYTTDNNNKTMYKIYIRNIKSICKIYKQGRWSGKTNIYTYIFKYTLKYIKNYATQKYTL